MKSLITLFLLLSSLSLFSQSENVAGKYARSFEMKNDDALKYEMTLNTDGTFTLYYHSFIKQGIPQEKNSYGKGTWTVVNNVVTFSTDAQNDIDEKHTLDFTNTKARFITKSPRDKTDKVVETKLQFLKSDIPWMSRIDLLKM
jgi:hypothetical protein